MSTLLDAGPRDATLQRLRQMTPESRPVWGVMSAHEAVCHMADHLAVALGEIPVQRVDDWFLRHVVKWLFVRAPMPIPRARISTAPEMLSTLPTDWDADRSRCESLLDRFATEEPRGPHPAFGPMRPSEWGVLCYRHMDHHLTQFGV